MRHALRRSRARASEREGVATAVAARLARAARTVAVAAVALAPVLAAASCGGPSDGSGADRRADIDRETFIDVYIALRRAAVEAEDSAAFVTRRGEILERHGIEAADLERFLDARRDDVRSLSLLWDTIERRMVTPPEELRDPDGAAPGDSTASDPDTDRDADEASPDRDGSIPSLPRPRG